jgi:hypothetical protein
MLCFNNNNVELSKCLIAAMKNFYPSNLNKHLNNHHSVEDATLFDAATNQPGNTPCISGGTGTDSFSCNTKEASSTIHTYFS